MNDKIRELIEELWESDKASALTNRAARALEAALTQQPWTELAASLYQACGAYDMPERILDVLSLAQRDEPFGHLIDGLLPCAPQPESEPIQPLDYVETPCSGIAKVQDLSSARLGVKMWRVRLLEPNFHGEYRIIPESRLAKLYTSPQPTPQVPDVDELAQFIRRIDGSNSMGAGALAEQICEWQCGTPYPSSAIGEELHTLLDSRGVPRELEGYELTLKGRQKWAVKHLGANSE